MEILVIIISSLVCCLLGLTIGFSQMIHVDVKRGLKPLTRNRLLSLLAKPTKEYKGIQILEFLLIIIAWLSVCFGSLIICGVLISRYAPNFLAQLYYLFPFFFIGLLIGVKAWQRIPKTESIQDD